MKHTLSLWLSLATPLLAADLVTTRQLTWEFATADNPSPSGETTNVQARIRTGSAGAWSPAIAFIGATNGVWEIAAVGGDGTVTVILPTLANLRVSARFYSDAMMFQSAAPVALFVGQPPSAFSDSFDAIVIPNEKANAQFQSKWQTRTWTWSLPSPTSGPLVLDVASVPARDMMLDCLIVELEEPINLPAEVGKLITGASNLQQSAAALLQAASVLQDKVGRIKLAQ